MMAINDGMKARGVPPCWTGDVGVPDVDVKATRFEETGRAILLPPTDIPGVMRFSLVTDPYGAALILFRPLGGEASRPVAKGSAAHFSWNELMAGGREGAFTFYAKMFGWTKTRTHDMGPLGLYQMFSSGGEDAVGGMKTKPRDMSMSGWA
jgi:uncharacterized protein